MEDLEGVDLGFLGFICFTG